MEQATCARGTTAQALPQEPQFFGSAATEVSQPLMSDASQSSHPKSQLAI